MEESIIIPTYTYWYRDLWRLYVITTKLNTLTDVPHQMAVGGVFVYVFAVYYVKTCERGRVKDFEQRSRVYKCGPL